VFEVIACEVEQALAVDRLAARELDRVADVATAPARSDGCL
jgi:hypothetical protein